MKTKRFLAILTLVVFMMTLLPLAAPAASKNQVTGTVPNVSAITPAGTLTTMGTIRISGDGVEGNITNGSFVVTLPTGVEWAGIYNNTDIQAAQTAGANAVTGLTITPVGQIDGVVTNGNTATFTVTGASIATTAAVITIPTYLDVTSVGTGPITASIQDISAGVTSNDLVIGNFTGGSVAVTMLNAPSRGEGAGLAFGTIRLTESSQGALAVGDTVTLRLPSGMTWGGATTASTVVPASNPHFSTVSGAGTRTLTLTAAAGTGRRIIDISTIVNIDSADAKMGDIEVVVGGIAKTGNPTVKIGAYKEYDATITVAEIKDIFAGRTNTDREDNKLGTLVLQEGLAGSVLPNRTIKLTAPSGVKFVTDAGITIDRVSGSDLSITAVLNTDRNVLTITPTTASTIAAKYEFKNIHIETAPDFEGDLVLAISGTGGLSGEVIPAKVVKPATIEVAPIANLRVGVQAQELGTITIIEAAKEALLVSPGARTINLVLDADVNWANTPTVKVVEGDLKIGTVTGAGTNTLIIPVDVDSRVASKIEVTGAKVTLNRSVPEGNVLVRLRGNATMLVNPPVDFPGRVNIMATNVATVVTQAPGDALFQGEVKLTVGSTTMSTSEGDIPMDVAPYIKGSRTFFPVSFVAQALGVRKDNIMWDNDTKKVTILTDNLSIQMTIADKNMIRNGVAIPMDVAPEIFNGRTMLPIRWLAQYGLGRTVDFDDVTGGVTIK